MKNIERYQGDSYAFHEKVIKSKKRTKADPGYKDRVKALGPDIQAKIDEYTEKFDSDTLEEISAIGYVGGQKEDLGKLYSYKGKNFQQLKVVLTTGENNRVDNTCQNCTLSEVNSFDHYLPKSEFSEHVVNPLNLIPSCTKCNGYKGTTWLSGNKRKFLNLYLDILPDVQYLFVDISIADNQINLNYRLDPKNNIDSDIFELLEDHYCELRLFDRFRENSDNIISELDTEISKYSSRLPIEDIKETILEEIQENYKVLGRNNWKLVLKDALVNSDEYLLNFNGL